MRSRAAVVTWTIATLFASLLVICGKVVPGAWKWEGIFLSPLGFWHIVRLVYAFCAFEEK